jgi:uncharacterized protein YdeI (YjbR/CyaY-like superfamily)
LKTPQECKDIKSLHTPKKLQQAITQIETTQSLERFPNNTCLYLVETYSKSRRKKNKMKKIEKLWCKTNNNPIEKQSFILRHYSECPCQ